MLNSFDGFPFFIHGFLTSMPFDVFSLFRREYSTTKNGYKIHSINCLFSSFFSYIDQLSCSWPFE